MSFSAHWLDQGWAVAPVLHELMERIEQSNRDGVRVALK
jgi:hypothetical protein